MSEQATLAVICGSGTPVGRAIAAQLEAAGLRVVAVDAPGAPTHPTADVTMQGEIWSESLWLEVHDRLTKTGAAVAVFVHALSGFASVPGLPSASDAEACERLLLSAECGSKALLPIMPPGQGAMVLLTSVLAGWDSRAGSPLFQASQAGLLGLSRALALDAAPFGVRVNAVGMGLVAEGKDDGAQETLRARIPLGAPARAEDIADAAMFLLSDDARHITGSNLAVDGGQSLQSWSNAPRGGGYSAPPQRGPILSPPARFEGRVVLVTGAAGGLGSAAAHRFAREGARLVLIDRDAAAVAHLAQSLTAQGTEVLPLAADVSDETSIAAAFARAEAQFGRLDVVFNNAGIGGLDVAIADLPVERWDEMMAVNLRGVFLGCKHGVPALRRAGGGAIVNMGSSTGRHDTITGGAAYMASKAAVEAMTKSLALQVAGDGIRANTICPGIIETALSFRQQQRGERDAFFAEFAARIPLGRVGQAEDVAAAVAFLASDRARHVTGASLLIDGGQTLRRWISAPDSEIERFDANHEGASA